MMTLIHFADKLCDLPVLLSVLSPWHTNDPRRVFFPQADLHVYKHLAAVSAHCHWLLLADKLFVDSEVHCHKMQSTQTMD